jgi:hypothetical protein
MNLRQMFSIWRRRWVLTTALLLLALVGTAAATQVLPKYYQAQSTVTLLPSRNISNANGGNPYLSFNGSLPVTAQLISFQVMDPRTAQSLANEGFTATYTTSPAASSTGPVLQTVVVGKNKALVEQTLSAVTNQIGAELASLQSGITNPANKITVETLSFDPKAALQVSKTARAIVIVFFFGMVLALAIPLIVDGQLGRSQKLAKSRKQPRRAVRATVPGVPGPRAQASPAPPAAAAPARPQQAATPATPVTPAARAEWSGQPAEPEWASKPAEPDWLPTTPTVRPESTAKPEWPAAPVPQPARTEWPAAPVPPPSRPEWMGQSATPPAERNGADTSARTDRPAKPATSLFGSDRHQPAKPATSIFERDRDEPGKPASSRFQRDEPAKPASSRFHRDDDGPAKPMPWDEDRSGDASPAAKASPAAGGGADSNGKGADSNGKNGSGKDGHDRETVAVPARSPNADDPDDDGPATQPQERVT